MSFFLFHQNMQNLGIGRNARGGADAAQTKIARYGEAFGSISAMLSRQGHVIISGFTEVLNDQSAFLGLQQIANRLDNNVLRYMVHCGTTVGGRREFVGIATPPPGSVYGFTRYTVDILSLGRVFLIPRGLGTELYDDRAPGVSGGLVDRWCSHVQPPVMPDYRAMVYVVVKIKWGGYESVQFAVGFLHNMYTLNEQRNLVAGKIPNMAQMIKNDHPGTQRVFIGGDFNVLPLARRSRGCVGMQPYSAGTNYWIDPDGRIRHGDGPILGGTTWSGRMYDYWFTESTPWTPLIRRGSAFPPQPNAYSQTMDKNILSDHAGVSLRII